MNPCAVCGAPHASHGLGPPAQPKQGWYCGICIQFQPHAQAMLARAAREAIEDDEIIVQ